jgi:hypothetical protein
MQIKRQRVDLKAFFTFCAPPIRMSNNLRIELSRYVLFNLMRPKTKGKGMHVLERHMTA